MAIIIAYWLYIFFLMSAFGIGFTAILKIRQVNPFIIPFMGSFIVSIIAGFWAIFGNLSTLFEVFLAIVALGTFILFKKENITYFFSLKAKISQLPILFKGLLAIIALLALAQCSSPPYILDNESYYIQTIKWLDTYGYVKGLSLIHI